MNPTAVTNSSTSNPPVPVVDRRPLICLLMVAGILASRWIWIAGLGDYGWTYELGMRVLQGEIPYRDFISTLPQLTSYTIVPFLVLLKGNLWAFALHLYLWWLAALLVGLRIAQAIELRPAAGSAAMFFAAALSLPATHLGHAYSYAGTFFFGLTLLQLLKHQKQARARHLFLAGAFAGLGIFAKQNIGIIAGLMGFSAIVYEAVINHRNDRLFRSAVQFTSGMAATFVPIFAFFAGKTGAFEVFQQMFSDAGAGKGGVLGMLFHVIPLIFFAPETPWRQLWTLVISGGLLLLFLGLVGRRMHQLQKHPDLLSASRPPRDYWRLIGVAIGIVALLSAISLLDLPQARSLFNKLHPDAIYEFHGFVAPLVFVAYSFFTAVAAICLLSAEHWRNPGFFLPIAALPLLLWGHELSCQGYLPFGAPVVVPLAMVLLEKTGLIRNTIPLACTAGVVLMVGLAASTQEGFQPPSFKSVERLPGDTKFAGLWARPAYCATVEELKENVGPRIKGRTTLWLCIGGPHLAWGGKSVFSVAALFGDTYNLRSETTLATRWQSPLSEFIFVGERNYCFGSRIFTTEALNQWLPQNYDPVWKSTRREAVLWQLRTQTNSPSR